MASYALQRHLVWCTQSRLGQKKKRAKVGNNNGQPRIAMPPLLAHPKPPGPMNFVFPSIWFKIWVAIAQKKKENIMC